MLGGAIGLLLGYWRTLSSLESWHEAQELLRLTDLRGFVLVAYLHWGSYGGALLGLLIAVWQVRTMKKPA